MRLRASLIAAIDPHERRPDCILCRPELTGVKLIVEALLCQQLSMGPLFDNRAVVDDQNLVGTADRTQPMGDDKAGAPRHQAQHCLLDLLRGARIDTAGCLIQDQYAGVGKDRASNRQHLTLALAQVAAPFREQRGIALGQPAVATDPAPLPTPLRGGASTAQPQ